MVPPVATRRTVLSGLAALAATAHAQEVRNFVIGTGDPTGTYYPVGGLIAEIVSAPPGGNPCRPGEVCGVEGLIAVAQTSEGSVANLEGLETARFDSAFCQADVAHEAWRGRGLFADRPFGELRALASLYPEHAQLVLARGAPMPPERLAVGAARSGTSLSASVVLPAFGIDPSAVERLPLNPSQALAAMAAGEVDGFLTVAGLPTAAVAEALASGAFRLAPIDLEGARATVGRRAHWRLATVPRGTYGLARPATSIAVPALWLARADLEVELAYALLEALWSPAARARLDAGHPAARRLVMDRALTGVSVPLHPAADRFYRAAGMLAGEHRIDRAD